MCVIPRAPTIPLSASVSNASSSTSCTDIGTMRIRSTISALPSFRSRSPSDAALNRSPALDASMLGAGAEYTASRNPASRAIRAVNTGQCAASFGEMAAIDAAAFATFPSRRNDFPPRCGASTDPLDGMSDEPVLREFQIADDLRRQIPRVVRARIHLESRRQLGGHCTPAHGALAAPARAPSVRRARDSPR